MGLSRTREAYRCIYDSSQGKDAANCGVEHVWTMATDEQ